MPLSANQLTAMPRNYATDAALRPQPTRTGPDDWSTPQSLIATLIREILPTLPPGPIWEPAAGGGGLANALRQHRVVFASDLKHDFLTGPPPAARLAAAITNPPFNKHSAFIQPGLELLDAEVTETLVLLFRHDHLQSESRTPPHCRLAAISRAELILLCPWRPRWIPGTTAAPRWTFSWIAWRHGAAGPPVLRYARPVKSLAAALPSDPSHTPRRRVVEEAAS